jgi:GxxExxY protein
MHELIFKDEAYDIAGAAMEVHNQLGCGFLEPVYQEALQIELNERRIPFLPQVELPINYKGRILQKKYIADFLAYGTIIIEIKTLDHLSSLEESQVLNYLKASNLPLALLINFGAEKLQWKRIILTPHLK